MNLFLKQAMLGVMLITTTITTIKAQLTRIPFETKGTHLYIKVRTGNSDTLRFIFDTGTTGAMIDSATAEKIGVAKENRQMVVVGGISGSERNITVLHQNLKLNQVELKDINLTLVNFNGLSKVLGGRLDGLIGYELLNKYVTAIDFDKKQLLLYTAIKEVDTTGYTSIPFEFNKGVLIPRFPIVITLLNGQTFSGRAMFDTGNAFSLLISAPFSKFHDLNPKLGATFPAWGLNAAAPDQVATIQSMSFGHFNFGKMTVRLTANENVAPKDGYLGILGIEVIRHFNVILDYANKKIYLKPNRSFNDDFKMEKQVVNKNNSAANDKATWSPVAKESVAFLNKNKTSPGVHQTASGLQYKNVKQGTGKIPVATDRITLYYKLSLWNGTHLYEDFNAQHPWIHHLDKTLPGIKEAVLDMPEGSKRILYIPADLAFGTEGYDQVPGGAVVVCELEVVKINP